MSLTSQQIFDEYARVVDRAVWRRRCYIAWLGQREDDVKQLVWLYIVKNCHRVREGARPHEVSAWLNLVVRTVLDRARYQKFCVTRYPGTPVVSCDDLEDVLPGTADDVDLRLDLERALAALDPEQADTIRSVLLIGEDESELAGQRGVSRQAVNQKKRRGLHALQRSLNEWR